MKRTAPLLLTGAIVAAAAAWYPTHAAAALCGMPSVSSVSPQVAAPGSSVTITGSNFTSLACSTSANIGGVNLSQNQMSVSNGAITFTAQPGMHGGVQVIETGVGGSNTSNGNVAFYAAPTVSGLSTSTPTASQGITVAGSGFSLTLPSGYEQVTASYLTSTGSTCAGASASVSSDTAIAVSAPGHYCNGALSLAISAPSNLGDPSHNLVSLYDAQPGHVVVQASDMKLSTTTPTAGDAITVTGSGFGTSGTATLGGAAVPTSSWSDTSIGMNVPDTAVNNSAVAFTRTGESSAIAAGTISTVTARVDGISPTSAHPGDAVTVSGGGFGSQAGTVALASTNATVSSWSPTSITFTVPAAAQTGQLTITPRDTLAPATEPSLKVTPNVSISPGVGGAPGSSGSSGSSGSNAKPLTQAQVQQVTQALSAPPPPLPPAVVGGTPPSIPPSHPTNGQIALSLKTTSTTAKPGKTVPFTVTLLAYGRPVGNAPVQLVVAYEPAPDASISPTSGVTDAKGQLHGVIHLSKVPGEMIILARTGEFSDEIQLVGSNTVAATSGAGALSGTNVLQRNLPILVVALAALLLLVGIGLRVGLWVASKDSLRAALIRERFHGVGAGVRRVLLRYVVALPTPPQRQRPAASGGDVQPDGGAASQVDVPAENEAAVSLQQVGADTTPDESKERVGAGS